VKSLRIRECYLDGVLRTVIETPVPLTPWQRLKVRDWALRDYRKRITQKRGWKRDAMDRIMCELDQNTFLERPVPKSDSERECLIFGR
jgi:hypothetical protein